MTQTQDPGSGGQSEAALPSDVTALPGDLKALPGDLPRHQLPARAIRYWQIQNLLTGLVVVAGVGVGMYFWTGLPDWIRIAAVAVSVLGSAGLVFVDPPLRYRRLWYAISETEIDIEEGLVVLTRTVVPMNRVQHLRMEHGLLADRFSLANLHVHTGAGVVSLRGLGRDEADRIRERVSELAHLSDDL